MREVKVNQVYRYYGVAGRYVCKARIISYNPFRDCSWTVSILDANNLGFVAGTTQHWSDRFLTSYGGLVLDESSTVKEILSRYECED